MAASSGSLCWVGGGRGPDALDAGEYAQREPTREGAREARRAVEPDQPLPHHVREPDVAHPDAGEGGHVGMDDQVHLEPRVLEAEVNLGPLEDEPPGRGAP